LPVAAEIVKFNFSGLLNHNVRTLLAFSRRGTFSLVISPILRMAASSSAVCGSPSASLESGFNTRERLPAPFLQTVALVGAHFTGEIIYRSAVHEVHGNLHSLVLASRRLTSGAAPVEINSPSAAPELTAFFSIVCLLGREFYIISVSKKTRAAIKHYGRSSYVQGIKHIVPCDISMNQDVAPNTYCSM
jgi:hypothetical protein